MHSIFKVKYLKTLAQVNVKYEAAVLRKKYNLTLNTISKRQLLTSSTYYNSKKMLPDNWGSKKHKGKRNVQLQTATMILSAEDEESLAPLRQSVKEQV